MPVTVRFITVGKTESAKAETASLPLTIGRGDDADWRIQHGLVSRCHCRLYWENGAVYVRDLGSLNGTYVGSERVGVQRIEPGELLTIGPVTFRVEYEPAADVGAGSADAGSDSDADGDE